MLSLMMYKFVMLSEVDVYVNQCRDNQIAIKVSPVVSWGINGEARTGRADCGLIVARVTRDCRGEHFCRGVTEVSYIMAAPVKKTGREFHSGLHMNG